MDEKILIGLTVVILLGTLAQWLGWRLRIPSILLLLGFGILAGPGFGWLNPDALFGDMIFPVVSIAVGIILFEGGLSLNIKEYRQSGGTILRLITVGAIVSWGLATFFAWWLLEFRLELALLFGAILVITGPTVIGPMLRQIRPRGRISHIVKWEGILNDPVGAVLAVLVLESILAGGLSGAPGTLLQGILLTIVIGVVGAVVGALILLIGMRNRWLPDFLHVPMTLTVVIGLFSLSNLLQHESGLLTVTLMGILLANQRSFPIQHIIDFKENLQVLLISCLFIVLGARVEVSTLLQVGWQSVLFLVAMIVVVRPLSILSSVVGSDLDWKERIFLMLMAPRGIVVTALASLFAFRLLEIGYPSAERLFAETLFVILGTVGFYGIAASIYARKVKIGTSDPQGVFFVGAHPWARQLALTLQKNGICVKLMDANSQSVEMARALGLTATVGNVHSYESIEEVDFSEIGRGLALTSNAEINAFAELALGRHLGITHVYHLASPELKLGTRGGSSDRQQNILFDEAATFECIEEEFYKGATFQAVLIESKDVLENLKSVSECFLPLFALLENGQLRVFSSRGKFEPPIGSVVLVMLRQNEQEA